MADCIFCKIIAGEMKAHVVYENESVLSFLDIHPASRGHVMVIPKVRYLAPLFAGVKTVMGLLDKALKPAGMNVGWNHGWAAGQRVAHLHVHIIPRHGGDGGGGIQSLIHSFVAEDLASVAAQIKAAA